MKKTILSCLLCLLVASAFAETTVPKGYVDLGLSSGTLWKIKVESPETTAKEAQEKFPDQIPSRDQIMELLYDCDWQYSRKGMTIIGPNGKKIYFDGGDKEYFNIYYLLWDNDSSAKEVCLSRKGLSFADLGFRNLSIRRVDKTRFNLTHVDKEMESDEYVDLGLISGTLWKKHNEKGYYTSRHAEDKYGNYVPTKEQMEELRYNCTWTRIKRPEGCLVTGPNGNTIFLPSEGYCNSGDVHPSSKFWMSYLTSTSGSDKYNSNYVLDGSSYGPDIESGFNSKSYSLRLVSDGATHTGKINSRPARNIPLHRVESNGKYGYADTTGTMVIQPQYDVAMDFSEGLAYVATYQEDKCVHGFIDEFGEMEIPLLNYKFDASLKGGFSGNEYCFTDGFVRYPGDTVYLNQSYSLFIVARPDEYSRSKGIHYVGPSDGFHSIRKADGVILANKKEDLVYAFDTASHRPYLSGLLGSGRRAVWANGFGITTRETWYLDVHTVYCRKGLVQANIYFVSLLQLEDSSMLCLCGDVNRDDTYWYKLYDSDGKMLAEGGDACVAYLRKRKFKIYETPGTIRISLLDRCQPRTDELPDAEFDFKSKDYVYVKFVEETFGLNPSDFRCRKGSLAALSRDSLQAYATDRVEYINPYTSVQDLYLALSEIPGYEGTDYALLYDLKDSTVQIISLPVEIAAHGMNGREGEPGERGSYGVLQECGTRGGNGGNGGNGGAGCAVHLRITGYFNSNLGRDRVWVDVRGGKGGAGGKGGEGGLHGTECPRYRIDPMGRAQKGYDGRRGRDGVLGSVDFIVTK